jgi:hypothetical protein
MNTKKKIIIGIAVAAGAIAAATGVAAAVWTVNGSGSGGATASIANNLQVQAVTPSTSNSTLYPGGPAGPVQLTIANPNPFAVTIVALNWGTPLSNAPTLCPSAQISLDPNAPTTVSQSVATLPANAPATSFTVPGVVDLAHTAPNGCQGLSFSVPVTVTAVQQ